MGPGFRIGFSFVDPLFQVIRLQSRRTWSFASLELGHRRLDFLLRRPQCQNALDHKEAPPGVPRRHKVPPMCQIHTASHLPGA